MDDRGPSFQCTCGHAFTVTPSTAGLTPPCPKCGKPGVPPAQQTPGGVSPRKAQSGIVEMPPANLVPGYEIQKRLGSGGMGDVFLARQTSLDRQVAIKLLPAELGKDKAYVETFLKEARSAAKVSHENIVGAVDFGEAGGRAFFVMEHVEGDTLFKVVRQKGALPEARALDIARQVAHGLRHAHKQGLIHRDIKPQNIMITPEGKAKILDFGLARDVSKDKGVQTEFVHSTPAYASPEQCRGEAALDHRSDLYSLGITLFEMLTGRRPFSGDTARKVMNKQVTEAPPEPRTIRPELSPNAEKIVLRMLRKQPAERFQTYDDLIAALDAAAGMPATVRRASGQHLKPAALPAKRPLPLLAGGAAAAVALAVVLVFALGGKKKEEEAGVRPAVPAPPAADPGVERALADAREFQQRSEGRHADYPAVRARWRELEAKYRGTPHHPRFTAPLAEFEGRMAAEADQIADSVLARADAHVKAGRLADALSALREFPDALAGSQANNRIGAKVLEVERALLTRFTEGQQEVQALLAALKFSDARSRLHLLRMALTLRDAKGAEDIPAQFRDGLEQLRQKIDADQLAAAKKADTPKPPDVPVTPPEDPPPVAAPVKGGPPVPALGKKGAPFLVLHQAALRSPADKRAEAAAVFGANSGKSALYAAAALFLARDEAAWKLAPQAVQVLDAYLAAAVTTEAEELTAEMHQAALVALAGQIAALGEAPLEAFHLFACAHVQEIQAKKGKVDPAAAAQARLAKAPVSELWGPAATVGRIEMAMLLSAPYGLRAARAAELAAGAADFPSKYLGALCSVKDPAFDAAAAQARWRKLAAEAPDAGWARYCESVADKIKAATTCEACLGQGRYPCPSCSAQGASVCGACRGTGYTVDPDTGKISCTACKGRKMFACAGCNGAKGLKCAGCDGKKTRATLPGGHFRWAIDLGICPACDGTGSPFVLAAYPCSKCEGYGRILEDVAREYGRLPAWLKSREGRALFLGLRWLALHQSPSGAWECTKWHANCPDKGCDPAPAGVLNLGTTSLGLLAFLNAGLGPDSEVELGGLPAGKVVRGAIEWILSCQQPDGAIVSGKTIKPVYEHLVATYALYVAAVQSVPGESFTEKDRSALREAAMRALKAALALQAKGGGWGYTAGAAGDTWVTSWGGLALLSAKEAGIEVPRANFVAILQWYDGVTDKRDLHVGYSPTQMAKVNLTGFETFAHHDTLSAFSGLVRSLIEGKATAAVAAADKMMLADLPNPDPLRRDYSYWGLGTMFLLQREQRKGTAWTQWTNATVRELLSLQQSADTCALGSWPADDRWSPLGGATYAVSMNALTLAHIAGTRPPPPKK